MRLYRIALIGILAAALAGCGVEPSPASNATPASPSPTAPLPGPSTGEDPLINSLPLIWLSVGQACGLLTISEASRLLVSPLGGMPVGVAVGGDHVECTYQDQGSQSIGRYIKVSISRIGFDVLADQVNLHRGAHTLEVGGFQGIGADAENDPVHDEAVLCVKLAKSTSDPALWIEAPTSIIARAAAALILPRLAALP